MRGCMWPVTWLPAARQMRQTAVTGANVDRGADWIKLRVDDNLGAGTKMPWAAVQATIDTAKAAGKPVATHIFYMDDAARSACNGYGDDRALGTRPRSIR